MKAAFQKLALVLLLSATSTLISGCGGEKPQVAATQIPGPPSYLQPIAVPKMKIGEDIRAHNNRRGRIIKKLNSVIAKGRDAWFQLQTDLAAPGK